MKFRHFEFKLFPRLKHKKKKKSKLCNPDFPRDIGLDKNFNYSKSGFQGYYDNFGAEDNILSQQIIPSQNGTIGHSRYRTYPLPELKIEVGNACRCVKCASVGSTDESNTWICVRGPEEEIPGYELSTGTPNTIPRIRTRIKTNPWLPSPKATPSPSPTDPVGSLLYSSSEYLGSTKSCPLGIARDERSGFHWTYNPSEIYGPVRTKCSSFHGLVKIAELENDSQDESEFGKTPNESARITTEVLRITGSKRHSTEHMTINLVKETENTVSQGSEVNVKKRFSFTEFLKYDTDGSNCTSPVVETIEFLSTVNCDIDFDYEEKLDELLETSDFPRDATFMSIKELLDEVNVDGTVVEETENEDKIIALNGSYADSLTDSVDDGDGLSLDDKDDDEIEKGYVTDTEDIMDDNLDNSNSFSNTDLTGYEDRNMQESIDTGYASVTRDSDSMSSRDDICISSDLDLEWDNDPVTRHFTLDYRFLEENRHQNQIQRPRSRSFDKSCVCNKKRRSRSLADIETSLDEKVTRLREEKCYVQRKIREAIEEEQIRQKQLLLFRSLSPVNRKEMLVQTLNDLKTRLENQSTRLQTSYDMVLALQERYTKRRKTLPRFQTVL